MTIEARKMEERSEATQTEAPQRNKVATVKIWAGIGAVILLYQIYVLICWVTGPNFVEVPSGPTPVPGWIKLCCDVVTYWIGIPATLWIWWQFVIKPWRRTGQFLTGESMITIWMTWFGWFWDPGANMTYSFFTYNSYMWNRGSWLADSPLWVSTMSGTGPGKMQAYPMIFDITVYCWGLAGIIILMAWCMRKIRARRPQMSNTMLVVSMFGPSLVVFACLEMFLMRCGIFNYHAPIPELTLWYGHYYQMPLLETIFAGLWTLGYACVVYFKNDKGELLCEHGLDQVKAGKVGKGLMRFCAFSAISVLVYFCSYNIPWNIHHWLVKPGWAKYAQEASYFNNYVCGPEVNIACPTKNLPVTYKGSGYFDLEGNFVARDGTRTPAYKVGADQVTKTRTSWPDPFWGYHPPVL
jgi:hypothetical protein